MSRDFIKLMKNYYLDIKGLSHQSESESDHGKNIEETRMHPSGMRTVRCSSRLVVGGGGSGRVVCLEVGGGLSREVVCPVGCIPPPVDRQTPVKTLPSLTSFPGGKNDKENVLTTILFRSAWILHLARRHFNPLSDSHDVPRVDKQNNRQTPLKTLPLPHRWRTVTIATCY